MEAKDIEELEDLLVIRLCQRNGWEYGGNEDYDTAVSEVKWFLSQPEISFKAGIKEVVDDMEEVINKAKVGFMISAICKCLEKW